MKPGHLYYLIGASGVGKDSLLDYLRCHLHEKNQVVIPQRYITRSVTAGGESHIELTPPAFRERLQAGGFAMHWESHGYLYGIGAEIIPLLDQGVQVIVNGSRHYLNTARAHYPNLRPVLVTVSHDKLLQRLVTRGRESAQEIEQRLLRAEALDAQLQDQDLLRLANDGPLEQAGKRLLEMVLQSLSLTSPGTGSAAATG